MIAIRRSQTRRALSRLAPGSDQTVFRVLDALEESAQPATVGEVGVALGVDQPRASRLVARAAEQGLVVRQADQRDGRRALLVLTARGRKVLAGAHRARREAFGRAMEGWTDSERADFARLLTMFTGALGGGPR